MADRTISGTSGNTSLRALRERLAAVAQELAEERRRKRGINASAVTNKRSSCTPVIDGSVLKNDIKQQLAKERREERKRQQEANKEKQLLEKEQKAKLQYEKQLEEKQRKLKEQKEKDERRRVSAEEKRKQKQAEDKEKFKAVVSRTMERCNRVDQRPKRWSWEGSTINAIRPRKTEQKRSSSLNRKDSQLHSGVDMGHEDNTPGMTKYVFRYVNVPVFTSDELKSSAVFSESPIITPVPVKLGITATEKVVTALKEEVEGPAKVNTENPPRMNMEAPSQVKVDGPSKANVEVALQNLEDVTELQDIFSNENIKVPTDMNVTSHPKSNVEELPMVSPDASPSIESSPIASDSSPVLSMGSSSFVSVEISPVVSMDGSPEESIDTSPELSMDSASMDMVPEGNIETPFKTSGELDLEASVGAQPEANVEASFKSPEMDKSNINLTTKKNLSSSKPCNRWSSSPTLAWRPPSPMKAMRNQKIRPPSPLPVSPKLSTKPSLSYKIIPVQNIIYVPNALDMITKKKEVIENHTINTESDKNCMPSSQVATKVSVEVHYAAYEQNGRMERETMQSVAGKSEDMTEKVDQVPIEEFSLYKDEQQARDLLKRYFEPSEVQEQQLQEGDSTMKSQDSAEKKKKEHERIMLQKFQERLERKKRVEEIMKKRTRKTDVNTSKAPERADKCISEEGEADDEGGTESDQDSLEVFPAGIKMSSTKLRKFHKNAKRRPQKLVFLRAGSDEVDSQKNIYFNGNSKAIKPSHVKDSTQAKSSKITIRRRLTLTARSRKAKEANTTLRSTLSFTTVSPEGMPDKIIDLSHNTESPIVKTTPNSNKQNEKDFMTTRQGPQAPLDHKKRGKPAPAPLTKVLSQLHLAGRAIDLEESFASGCSRVPFGGEEEDSDI